MLLLKPGHLIWRMGALPAAQCKLPALSSSLRGLLLKQPRFCGCGSPNLVILCAKSSSFASVSEVSVKVSKVQKTVNLNDEQDIAVKTQASCVRVVAGPGSGKTLVLTHRIAHEITHNGIDPADILCITFTNKAAQEVRERLNSLVGKDVADKFTVSTFHSFCSKLLRQLLPATKPEFGLSKDFVIYDDTDCEKVLKEIFTKVAQSHLSAQSGNTTYDSEKYRLNLLIRVENMIKTEGTTPMKFKIPAEDLKRGTSLVHLAKAVNLQTFVAKKRKTDVLDRPRVLTDDVMKLARLYEDSLRENNAADFDDLISLTIYELHQAPAARKSCEQRWSCVLVDEFQDTDKAQYELIRLVCSSNQNLFVVGDLDQAIYGWRGAESKNMQFLLSNDFPSITTLQLKKNYRSSKSIISVASKIIGNSLINRRIGSLEALTPVPIKPLGAPVKVCWLESPDEECQFVANEILQTRKGRWGDCAVLYRTHRQSFLLESNLIKAGIPYRILGAIPLFSHKVVKDLLSYLHFILNGDDELALARIINTPPRAIGEKTLFQLKRWAYTQHVPLSKALLRLKEDSPSHKDLGITAKARTAVLKFCELMNSLVELSENESVLAVLVAIIEKTGFKKYVEDHSDDQRTLEKRSQCIEQLLDSAAAAETKHGKGRSSLTMFLQDVMLIAEATSKKREGDENTVGLSTLHAAKGMEFKCVFIIGLNKGTLPHENSDPEEERRLFYVGITRAQEQLYLTHTHGYGYSKQTTTSDDEDEQEDRFKRTNEISGFLKEVIGSRRVRLYPETWNGKLQ